MAGPPVERPTAGERAAEAVERTRLTFRRLTGLDRSGPPPRETLREAPWRPWTIPNAITYVRFALLPLFLVLALSSDTGTEPLPAIIFAVIGWGDYADGIAARVTGQYSKLGALLDPIIDRGLILAGVVVVWHFETLPRWALPRRPMASAAPDSSDRLPTVRRSGQPSSSASVNFSPAPAARSSSRTSRPTVRSSS